MQFKQFFLVLCVLTLIFSACQKDDEIIVTPPDEEPPVEDNTFIIKTIVDDSDTLNFPFEECSFSSYTQSSSYGSGTALLNGVDYNIKNLTTRLRASNNVLYFRLEFKQPETEGEINLTRVSEIINSEINNGQSEYFNLSLALEINDVYYRNQRSDYSFDSHSSDYSYEITEYEFGYDAECLATSAIKLKGNFKGTFSDYEFGVAVDSIYVEVPDFEVLVLIY